MFEFDQKSVNSNTQCTGDGREIDSDSVTEFLGISFLFYTAVEVLLREFLYSSKPDSGEGGECTNYCI